MPSSDEYAGAAQSFRTLAVTLADDASAVVRSVAELSSAIGHGPVVTSIAGSLVEAGDQLVAAARALVDIAGLCDRRAEVCLQYQRSWDAHLRLAPHIRIVTPPPARPAPWVG